MSYTLAIVGGGKMGEAIAAGLVSSGALEACRIIVADPSEARRQVFSAHGIATAADAHEIVGNAQVVLIAVKPQVIDAVVTHVSEHLPADVILVSIAAGVTTSRLAALLPERTAVVRVMPNTPAMVGAGMAVVSGGADASEGQVERVRALFEAVGEAIVVDERAQDAATAISGSGPAYFALVIDALARGGVAQGLSREVAQLLAIQTMRGTAELLSATQMHPQELIDGVSSPGGTTVAALDALDAGGIRTAISSAVAAAVKRAKELGS